MLEVAVVVVESVLSVASERDFRAADEQRMGNKQVARGARRSVPEATAERVAFVEPRLCAERSDETRRQGPTIRFSSRYVRCSYRAEAPATSPRSKASSPSRARTAPSAGLRRRPLESLLISVPVSASLEPPQPASAHAALNVTMRTDCRFIPNLSVMQRRIPVPARTRTAAAALQCRALDACSGRAKVTAFQRLGARLKSSARGRGNSEGPVLARPGRRRSRLGSASRSGMSLGAQARLLFRIKQGLCRGKRHAAPSRRPHTARALSPARRWQRACPIHFPTPRRVLGFVLPGFVLHEAA